VCKWPNSIVQRRDGKACILSGGKSEGGKNSERGRLGGFVSNAKKSWCPEEEKPKLEIGVGNFPNREESGSSERAERGLITSRRKKGGCRRGYSLSLLGF